MLRHRLAHRLWTLANGRHARRFQRADRNPRRAQLELLDSFLSRNAGTAYGRVHGYRSIASLDDFRERVPVVDHDTLEPWVERILDGEPNVLTAEPVLAVERTSGSSGAVKYIPYTRTLLREFQRAVGAWMHDLFHHRPALLDGTQYWSLTPLASRETVTAGGVPIGLGEDLDYFGPFERSCLRQVIEVPDGAVAAPDVEACLQETARHLARCPELRFISVWCPSFLVLLAEALPASPRELWPDLQLISCWTSAGSRRHLPRLREHFPDVEIQGKGLLATEGVVTVPQVGGGEPIPALTSHFLEFLDDSGTPHLVDELLSGRTYSVVLTTGGGLARYRLGDRVLVHPGGELEFVGRDGQVSDLCGEKLSESFVQPIVEDAARHFDLDAVPFLAPEWGTPPHYLVFLETGTADPVAVARWIEARLRASYHYDYCRSLGQLGALEGITVEEGARRYLQGCESLGQRAGGVKSSSLRRELGWRERMVARART